MERAIDEFPKHEHADGINGQFGIVIKGALQRDA
jgi:hypothetical protein